MEEFQEKQKKEKDPIERYCYEIRCERAAYEITYEEMRENMVANVKHMIALEEQERERLNDNQPNQMECPSYNGRRRAEIKAINNRAKETRTI